MLVRAGCLVLLVAALALGYMYREPLGDLVRRLRGLPPRDRSEFAQPAPGGGAAAESTLARLERQGGPAFVDLDAAMLAALLDDELNRTGRRMVDSIRVALLEGEVRVRGSLEVARVPRNLLGPLAGAIGPWEPVEVGGALRADSTGRVYWSVTALRVRDFPFPRSTLPALVRQLRLAQSEDGAVQIPGLRGVGDVRVSPGVVRLYRSSPR